MLSTERVTVEAAIVFVNRHLIMLQCCVLCERTHGERGGYDLTMYDNWSEGYQEVLLYKIQVG